MDRPLKTGTASGRFSARNEGDSPVGAWARVVKHFDPAVNMTPHDAIGLWVHGDGKGALLNLQLTNLPEYFRTIDDHHVKVDFKGWRYFELIETEFFDLIVTDYNMPEVDGEQLSQFIRNQSTQQSVPVLMVTSETDSSRLAGIAQSGVSAVFDKPFTVETLRETIQRVL